MCNFFQVRRVFLEHFSHLQMLARITCMGNMDFHYNIITRHFLFYQTCTGLEFKDNSCYFIRKVSLIYSRSGGNKG